jgi:predicted Rossmann fold flavoprotein
MSDVDAHVVVVGAGGAGLLAAAVAASSGASTLLVERNKRPGIKIRISGGGKCNVTHNGSVDDLLAGFPRSEARFLRHSLHECTNDDVREILRRHGVETTVRSDGRVFPTSLRADDVVEALVRHLRISGARLLLGEYVASVDIGGGGVTGISTRSRQIRAGAVIVATGGASYAKTGTTGDGFRWGKNAGHTIVPVRPALAPIRVDPPLPPLWRGVALRSGRLNAMAGARVVASWPGDVLFTHEGVSGPAVLETSRAIATFDPQGAVHLTYDFFPSEDVQKVDCRLLDLVVQNQGKLVRTLLDVFLPERIVANVLATAGVPEDRRGYALTRTERQSLARSLKAWDIGRVERIDRDRGEVTAGGITLGEIDPRTMASKLVRGLYFAGEVIDVAGRVGGYNLQAAFSTGYLAGRSAAGYVHDLLNNR